MSSQRRFIAQIALLITVLTPSALSFSSSFSPLQGLAQTPTEQLATADRLRQQATVQLKNRQFSAALESLQQALKIYQQLNDTTKEGYILSDLSGAYHQMGDIKGEVEYQKRLIELAHRQGDQDREAVLLRALGDTYTCHADFKNALASYQNGLAIAQETQDQMEQGLVKSEIGNVLYKQGNFSEAEKIFRTGIVTLEDERAEYHRIAQIDDDRNQFYLKLQEETYKSLQQVLVAQNKYDDALEIAEQSRTRALVELLAKRQSDNANPESAIALPNLPLLRQIAKTQNATLVEYSTFYDRLKAGCIGDINAWGQNVKLVTWVIKPTGEIEHRLVDLKPFLQQQNLSLVDLVLDSRNSIGVGNRGLGVMSREEGTQQTQRLQQLHQILIQPIADLLPNNQAAHIIFIPQDALFYVPFPALQDSTGKYLITQHTILTAPSIQLLDLTHKSQQQGSNGTGALVVGNPAPMPLQLPALPGAEREAKAVAQLLNTQPLIGSQATKEAVLEQMQTAKIVHLATHGLLDDLNGVDSAIAVAKSNQNNGLIKASEILSFPLKADLVVLSACDTGLGEITGEGVIGLSRSLLAAGAKSVIVSLWSIPDAPTESLMTEFYRQLQQNSDKATALRNAMIKTQQQHPNPKDWAAFTLIGEAE